MANRFCKDWWPVSRKDDVLEELPQAFDLRVVKRHGIVQENRGPGDLEERCNLEPALEADGKMHDRLHMKYDEEIGYGRYIMPSV
jgi:hypothetical protein